MASPSSSSWSPHLQQHQGQHAHAYPHPHLGGKGLPPPLPTHAARPPSSSPVSSSRYSTLGPPPDLTERYRAKAKYLDIQKRYFRGIEIRKDLEVELAEKEAKVQALQDEVDLLLDQIHDSDYAHLVPARDDLFSDDDEGEDAVAEGADVDAAQVKDEDGDGAPVSRRGKGPTKRSLEDEEDERRRQLEEKYGIDGSRQNVTYVEPPTEPTPLPAPAPAAEAPPPKRLKLTFGGSGGGATASLA